MLYELRHQKNHWIVDIILELNKLGFYTTTSQPGKTSHLATGEVRKQRAFVRGYMKKDIADRLVDLFASANFIWARSETNNNYPVAISECGCGSVIFNMDNEPATLRFDEGDFDQSYNLDLPLRRPYKMIHQEMAQLPSHLTDMSEFEIVDMRWDNNDYLWETLLEYMRIAIKK